MIYRAIGFTFCVLVWTALANSMTSVNVLARNNLAVNTVNGGDTSFLAQRWTEGVASMPVYWVMLMAICIVFWLPPALSKINKN